MKTRIFTFLLIVLFIVSSLGLQTFAEETPNSIKINNTTLTFNKIIYADSAIGNDTTGDGSKMNPYKSITKAIASSSDGNAIYLKGTFTSPSYTLHLSNTSAQKNLTFIGEQENTIIEGTGNLQTINVTENYEYTFYRITFKTNHTSIGSMLMYVSGNPILKFYNCAFYSNQSGLVSGSANINTKIEVYNCYVKLGGPYNYLYKSNANNQFKFVNTITALHKSDRLDENGLSYTNQIITSVHDPLNQTYIDHTVKTNAIDIGTGFDPNGTQADLGVYGGEFAWSSQTNQEVPPAPLNLTATAGDAQVVLAWESALGATGYNVKRSLTPGGPYTTIAENVSEITYTDIDVSNGTTYYYIVSAINSAGESANSNEVSATPQAIVVPPSGNAILTITLVNGIEKEYDLSMAKVQEFISWYESEGSGKPYFMFDKNSNMGPFKSRKDYIAFDKIVSFEVNEY